MYNWLPFQFFFIISICRSQATTLFCVPCLPVDDVFAYVCKEEQISDEEILASSSDEENDKTSCPSDRLLEAWNQRKEKRIGSQETPKQGCFTP